MTAPKVQPADPQVEDPGGDEFMQALRRITVQRDNARRIADVLAPALRRTVEYAKDALTFAKGNGDPAMQILQDIEAGEQALDAHETKDWTP